MAVHAVFLVSPKMFSHPGIIAAGNKATGLWVRCGSWCVAQDRSFTVPRHLVTMLGSNARTAQHLVNAGLWETVGRDWRYVPDEYLWTYEYREEVRRPGIAQWLRNAVLVRDGFVCLHCGATDDLQMDHVWPWSKGGKTTLANLQTLCGPCNRAKGASV